MDHVADARQPPPSSDGPASMRWVGVIGASVAAFLALATASSTYLSMLTHGHSFVRLLGWQLGCWSFWAIVAPWVVRVSGRQGFWRLAGLGVALTVLHAVAAAALAVWLQPFVPVISYDFGRALANLWWFPLLVDPLAYGLLVVGGRVLAAHERSRQFELRESQLESQLARAQLDALRLEIQPHFLFNTLNSIAALIRVHDHAGALSMLLGLSDLMRATLDEPAGHLAPLGREMHVIRQYVELQRIRFGDRLNVTYEVDAACEAIAIPTLLLQPLVENSLRHGLAPQARPCHLVIGATQSGDELRLWVSDDGAGLRPGFDLNRDAGTGLRNTRSRLERLYGQAATLIVRPNAAGGAIVELTLPSAGVAQAPLPVTGAA